MLSRQRDPPLVRRGDDNEGKPLNQIKMLPQQSPAFNLLQGIEMGDVRGGESKRDCVSHNVTSPCTETCSTSRGAGAGRVRRLFALHDLSDFIPNERMHVVPFISVLENQRAVSVEEK